ncbi:MAG: tripartite tricarboxylate transporter substrate binding protein [Betaproteobacteria bacterium]|nr:MAG: tripartite tricarboxylate transporter substrate binding protein [Betaproteobacteria bacterium]
MLKKAVLAFAAASFAVAAWGQQYPNRPVRVVVAAATGGPDIVARIVAAELTTQLGQSFFVENRPGANGIVGCDLVAKAPPDGYTLLVYSAGLVVNPYVHKSLPYDTEKDFAPVTNLTSSGGLFLAVNPSLPVSSLQEFVEYAKKSGGRLAYSTPGIGNNWHLATEVFSQMAGIKMTHVPYKGGGPAAAALVSGEVQAMLVSPAPIMPHYKSQKVRVLAYTGMKPNAAAPEVPLMKDAGLSYTYDGGWFGMFAPARTSPEILDKLAREVRSAMQKPQVLDRLAKMGLEPAAGTPEEFHKFFLAEFKAYGEMARVAGVKPE